MFKCPVTKYNLYKQVYGVKTALILSKNQSAQFETSPLQWYISPVSELKVVLRLGNTFIKNHVESEQKQRNLINWWGKHLKNSPPELQNHNTGNNNLILHVNVTKTSCKCTAGPVRLLHFLSSITGGSSAFEDLSFGHICRWHVRIRLLPFHLSGSPISANVMRNKRSRCSDTFVVY